MKVFWSWQSDTPGKIGRFFIRDALLAAIEEIKNGEINEPEREVVDEMHHDQDRQGIPGIPDLARTIFDKIDAAAVVLADVTVTAQSKDRVKTDKRRQKGHINSNVAIELGYALKSRTDRRVMMVFNSHYGSYEDLPFDLRHKGGGIIFSLSPDADKKTIEKEAKNLKSQLAAALRLHVAEVAKERTQVPAPPFQETPSTYSTATYFELDEPLCNRGEAGIDEVSFSYHAQCLSYLRLIPHVPLPETFMLADLLKAANQVPLLDGIPGHVSTALNRYGAIAFQTNGYDSKNHAPLRSSTQLFANGEIWTISSALIRQSQLKELPNLRIPLPALPSQGFERAYHVYLRNVLGFAEKILGISPPWIVEAGVTGTDGMHIGVAPSGYLGPIKSPTVIKRATLENAEDGEVSRTLLKFFELIYDAAGQRRPDDVYNFERQAG